MKRNIKKGQYVQVIAKIERDDSDMMRWDDSGNMDHLLNSGKWYIVESIEGSQVELNCEGWLWTFLNSCLSDGVDEIPINAPVKEVAKIKKPRLKSLRALVEAAVKREEGNHISNYGIRTTEGDKFNINDICYAQLAIGGGAIPKELAVSLGNYVRLVPEDKQTVYKEYTKYILESPAWGLPFLTKNSTTAFRYGILMDVSQPLSRIVASLTALREGVEFPQKLNLFDELLKAGYSGDVAYFISSVFCEEGEGYTLVIYGSSHKILATLHSLQGVVQFFKSGYRDLREKPYTEQKTSWRCQNAVAETRHNLPRDIKELCHFTDIDSGWQKKTIVTKEDLLKFADTLTEMIGAK